MVHSQDSDKGMEYNPKAIGLIARCPHCPQSGNIRVLHEVKLMLVVPKKQPEEFVIDDWICTHCRRGSSGRDYATQEPRKSTAIPIYSRYRHIRHNDKERLSLFI